MNIDFVVTGTRSPAHATAAREIILEYAKKHPTLTVNVYHLCTSEERTAKAMVSELDWLLYNAATASIIAHVEYAHISSIRSLTLSRLATLAAEFNPQTHIRITKQSPGRIKIPLDTVIFGVVSVYYNNHNNERKLRHMDSNFLSLPEVAILVPMTLRGVTDKRQIPFMSHLAPCLEKTLAHSQFGRAIYIGIDEDEDIPAQTMQIILRRGKLLFHQKRDVQVIRFPAAWRRDKNMARMYNALFQRAVMDGYDFAIQMQDDARPETTGWDRKLAAFLCSNPLALGAYSLCDRWDPLRCNNAMVSRTHFDVFGYLFNPTAPDSSLWMQGVLGGFCKIINPLHITNGIRHERRRHNATTQVYASYGKVYEQTTAERDIVAGIFTRVRE